jgi:high-affinity iron transporter
MRRLLAPGVAVALLAPIAWAQAETAKGNAEKGRVVYEHNCQACHGAALDGHGPDASKLIKPPANFHDKRSRKKGEAELEIIIKTGQTFTDMHRWRDTLNDGQIRDVIAYIRSNAPHIIE